jgi:hypothetical protein
MSRMTRMALAVPLAAVLLIGLALALTRQGRLREYPAAAAWSATL